MTSNTKKLSNDGQKFHSVFGLIGKLRLKILLSNIKSPGQVKFSGTHHLMPLQLTLTPTLTSILKSNNAKYDGYIRGGYSVLIINVTLQWIGMTLISMGTGKLYIVCDSQTTVEVTRAKRSEISKHCAPAVARRSQKFSPRRRPPSRGLREAKI